MEPQFDVEAWARETSVGRHIFNHRFRFFGSELPGWSLVKAAVMNRDDELRETTYLWQSGEAPERELVSVNVAELPEWRRAQEHLLAMLGHSMRGDLPRASGLLADLGDVAFVGREPESDVAAAVLFARGNVAVAVNSAGSAIVDVTPFAVVADRMLGATGPYFDVPGLHATRRKPPSEAAGAMPLILKVDEGGDTWLKAIAPDGELRRSGEGLVYSGAAAGTTSVQLFEIGKAGAAGEPVEPGRRSGTGRAIAMTIAAAALLALIYLLAKAAGLTGSP